MNTTSERRVRVWNFPLSVTPRTQWTPLMLPRQTMRKTTFGRPPQGSCAALDQIIPDNKSKVGRKALIADQARLAQAEARKQSAA